MVGLMADDGGERIKSLIDCVTFAVDNPSKLEFLHQLKHQLLSQLQQEDSSFSQFLPSLLSLHSDAFSPVRKCVSEVIGEIGLRHLEFLPEIIPELLTVVDDDTPAVARQAITSGTSIFCCTLEKIAIQGLCASKLDDSLESAWEWMLKLKEKIYSIAFESGCDGIRLLALKFVAAIILIYTPDPNGNAEPPPQLIGGSYANGNGREVEFNISWLRKGHSILKLGDLSLEASRSLGLFLDQLRLPLVKSLSTSMVVVLINCLSAIAVKRPSFYGRILPVLLGLDPSNSVIKGLHAYGVQNALKNAYLSCLKCAHPSATPWRDRLLSALRELGAGELAEKALEGVCNTNGNVKEEKVVPAVKEEQSPELLESAHKVGRKRSSDLDIGNRNEDDDTPGKRARSMHSPSEDLNIKSDALRTGVEVKSDSSGQTMSKTDDLDAVQQLIGLFGALVAQGEKAAASIEILVSGICPDLLAEVVIANLRNLPPTRPMVEGDEIQENMGLHQKRVDPDTPFGQVSLFFTNALHSSGSGHMSATMDTTSHNIKTSLLEESHVMDVVDSHDACVTSNKSNDLITTDIPSTSTSGSLLNMTKGSVVAYEFQDVGPTETAIPGLDDTRGDGPLDAVTSSLASADMDDGSQDQVTSVVERSKEELLLSLSTERSEEFSSKIAGLDANIGMASTASSLGPVQQFVLPKMSAPVVVLSVEDKDVLQKLVFLRIVEAYKQVAVSGGSQLRFSLLSYLGNELSLDLDLWTCLQKHILSDYVNNEGHELTLRVLYRLYGEAEEERDFFSSRTATSVYETFLLKVAETLRDSFPASDKSLSRLFSEVPYLPESSLKLLECLCYPEVGDKDEKESHSGDRVTQGLSAVWSLIMLRPTLRDVLLKIALKSAAHHMEEVRMKAIRLVANKLYPLPSITLQIEEFAKEKLLSVVDTHSADTADIDKSSLQSQKNPDLLLATKDQTSGETMPMESCSRTSQSGIPGSVPNTSLSEAQRWMSLYFALCTKKHGLLHQIFIFYKSSPESVKQAIHCHMPILIRTVGASPSLIEILSDPPAGSEKLVVQVLHTLTDGRVPSNELISTIKKLYETKMKDIEILFPIFPFLPKEEVLSVFPQIVNLSQDKFQASLTRLLQGSTPSGPVLTPPEVLIAIHSIDPEKAGIPLKKVTDACNACFEQRQLFTQQVIAKVLNQLVEQIHPPLLFMRTVLQAIGAFPALVDFIMGILSRLVSKQIWKYPKLWVGFLKCAQLTQPHSFNVLLQLPQAQLEGALNKIPVLKAPLAAHANQQNLKSTLPRSVLAVLGIASDSQAGSQTQSVQQTKIKEASGNTSDSQSGSQSQSAQLIKTNESFGVASDAQAEDAASSDKVVNDKSKESSGGS